MVEAFLDASVCIDLLRGQVAPEQTGILRRYDGGMVLSVVTLAELEVGVAKSKAPATGRHKLGQFLEAYPVLAFAPDAAQHYGEIRAYLEAKGSPIGPLDQLIAAQARSAGALLITANVREFRRVPGLKCVAWR
jgi:tRNA(fMet)-specific endonuclease VapC